MKFIVKPRNRYIEVIAQGKEGVAIFPTYVPGSYVIRELERNVVEIEGFRITKNRFYVKENFKYLVYASSRDQREAISTNDYLFINPPAVFPFQNIYEKYCVKIETNWKVATTLQEENGYYCADNYHEFADSPIEASPELKVLQVDEGHYVSTIDDVDLTMLGRIVSEADKVIEPKDKYIFHFRRSDRNFGGIEHKKSTGIVVPWDKKDLSILFAHEYFHRLNVKKLVPKDLNHNYEKEVYTDLLWFAEGFTDYMAHLICLRAGLNTPEEIFRRVLQSLHNLTFPGAKRVSLSEASKTAWIKYYKQDENFLNASISYYDGGLALGFYVDLRLAERGNRIDELFKTLPERYTFRDVEKTLEGLGFHELELANKPAYHILEAIGRVIDLQFVDKGKKYYGLLLDNQRVKFVEENSPADLAGLMPEDQIVGVDGIYKPLEVKDYVKLHVIREGRLKQIELIAGENPGHSLRGKIEEEYARKIFSRDMVEAVYNSVII
ncbi:peptidase M61 [Sulfolobus acidocaldarius SUSAZ]|nr:peptidase M61 [Sulfolobus acidocaldarius SUSAZ]